MLFTRMIPAATTVVELYCSHRACDRVRHELFFFFCFCSAWRVGLPNGTAIEISRDGGASRLCTLLLLQYYYCTAIIPLQLLNGATYSVYPRQTTSQVSCCGCRRTLPGRSCAPDSMPRFPRSPDASPSTAGRRTTPTLAA